MSGWGFTARPCVTVNNAVFRGFGGTTGTRQALARAIAERGAFVKSPHGNGSDGISEATRITVEEAAILQGYPRDFRFAGKKGKIGLQIGNAVPPPVAKAVLETLWS